MDSRRRAGANGGWPGSPPERHIWRSRSDRYSVQLEGVMSARVLMPFSSVCRARHAWRSGESALDGGTRAPQDRWNLADT